MGNEQAVRQALRTAPASMRAMAREAGVSPTLLRLIRDGERRATPTTVVALIEAMERLGGRFTEAADILRDAKGGEHDG